MIVGSNLPWFLFLHTFERCIFRALMTKNHSLKNILVVAYSQSGGVARGIKALCKPIEDNCSINIEYFWIQPGENYPYPWKKYRFFEIFPECVLGESSENLTDSTFLREHYDLIIIGWQPWYLSPSLPVQAFFKSDCARILRDSPVVSLIGCRSMWYSAYDQMQILVEREGGRIVDNIVCTHQGHSLATFFTTVRMLWTGKKNSLMGLPNGGFADTEFGKLEELGEVIVKNKDCFNYKMDPILSSFDTAQVRDGTMWAEMFGRAYYRPLARLMRMTGTQKSRFRIVPNVLFGLHLIPAIVIILVSASVSRVLIRVVAGDAYFQKWISKFRYPYDVIPGNGSRKLTESQ